MAAWFDAHNHLQDPRLASAGVAHGPTGFAGVAGGIVNGTAQADWDRVAELVTGQPGQLWPAYGVHPWRAHTVQGDWLGELRGRLETNPAASVGEIGLDQWVEQPSIDVQREVFTAQLALARELDRPATIHCLRAWGPLFEVFAGQAPPSRFLMHAFNGSIEVARRLLAMGAYFSFSGYFLHERKAALLEVFRQIPRERLLVETDAPDLCPPQPAHPLPDGLNHPANLPAIGEALAAHLDLSPAELAKLTAENARRCFGLP
ncbi:MAG TPA: TatD family hydrolase [Luteolibacter sp.]|nr:TatD family hydrolase [Luteolibacter sp.]